MAVNDDIQINDLPSEDFDRNLLGTVIKEDRTKSHLFFLLAFIGLCLIVLLSFFLFKNLSKGKDQVFLENMQDKQFVVRLYRETVNVFKSAHPTYRDLVWSISKAVDVGETNLKDYQGYDSPYIKEKYLGVFWALKGLLRYKIEGYMDSKGKEGTLFYNQTLSRLGKIKLEFFEEGVRYNLPLIEATEIVDKIEEISKAKQKSARVFYDPSYVQDLKNKLKNIQRTESFTIASPSLILGKWYRYHNNIELAQRCFGNIIDYVEGYSYAGFSYQGIKPNKTNAIWEEYVQSLEAMAEIFFQQKKFRRARSYLLRIFDVPSSYDNFITEDVSNKLNTINELILSKKEDIEIVKLAIKDPGRLQTFPLFSIDDSIINWASFVNKLTKEEDLIPGTPMRLLWQQFSSSEQEILILKGSRVESDASLKQILIKGMNNLIRDSGFYQRVKFDSNILTAMGQRLYLMTQNKNLTNLEYQYLNRDILDGMNPREFKQSFRLSTGERLHNGLEEEQIVQLLDLYEERKHIPETDQAQQNQIDALIESIYSKEFQLTVLHLHSELVTWADLFRSRIKLYENIFDKQRNIIHSIEIQVKDYSTHKIIDFAALEQLKANEDVAIRKQLESKILKDDAESQLQNVEKEIENLNQNLKQKLIQLEVELVSLDDQQHRLRSKQLNNRQPFLNVLNKKIVLHSQYLNLLQHLKKVEGNLSLQNLYRDQQAQEVDIKYYKDRLKKMKGDEREEAQKALVELKERRNHTVMQFNKLFLPLKNVVENIAKEEASLWQLKSDLNSVETEILTLVGNKKTPGKLQIQTDRRSELLLSSSNKMLQNQSLKEEITQLNQKISKNQQRLHVLLKLRDKAVTSLAVFYPEALDSELAINKRNILEEYLESQKKLNDKYQILKRESNIYNNLLFHNEMISSAMNRINQILNQMNILEERKVSEIVRLMQQIVQAQNRLEQDQLNLKRLHETKTLKPQLNVLSGIGIELDHLALYKMQEQMGIKIGDYEQAFMRHQSIMRKLKQALEQKKNLEAKKNDALYSQNQIVIDSLIPKTTQIEKLISTLSLEQEKVNKLLRNMAKKFIKSKGTIRNYLAKSKPRMDKLEEKTKNLNKELAYQDKQLSETVKELFKSVKKLKPVVISLQVGDLTSIDALIQNQENELSRLKIIQSIKRRENYFKSKSLWLLGKSLYAQSNLSNYKNLEYANLLPNLEKSKEELLANKPIYEEFDQTYVYNHISGPQSDVDKTKREINYQSWINSLEKNALKILYEELPKYYTDDTNDPRDELLDSTRAMDLAAYMARSKFLVGKIHLHRAHRFAKASRKGIYHSKLAQQELEKSEASFNGFINFVYEQEQANEWGATQQITEQSFGSLEFPTRARKNYNQTEEALLFLGIIKNLQGKYHQAIEVFRNILIDISLPNKLVDENQDIYLEQIDPILKLTNQYQLQALPEYISILSEKRIGHEVLYRLGKTYQKLFDAAYEKSEKNKIEAEGPLNNEKVKEYGNKAIAYFSQLILTQAYSPYRRAALFNRAQIQKIFLDFESAKKDFLAILEKNTLAEASSFDQLMSENLKGDVFYELAPPYSIVAFELGKLYFETGEYDSATELFMQAQQNTFDYEYVIRSKIAYAEALVANKKWLLADLFISELIREGQVIIDKYKSYYSPDLNLMLGKVKDALGKFSSALDVYKGILEYIPPRLLDNRKELNLNDKVGLQLLKIDYRDSIRPLALACERSADLYLLRREFGLAKKYYTDAYKLFQILPWKEDEVLREKTESEYLAYKQEHLMSCDWGRLKTEASELIYVDVERFRQDLELETVKNNKLEPKEMSYHLEEALSIIHKNNDLHNEMLHRLNQFKAKYTALLPEKIQEEKLTLQKQEHQLKDALNYKHYTALDNIQTLLKNIKNSTSKNIIAEFMIRYEPGKLENKLLNQFVLDFIPSLNLTSDDRDQMVSTKSNLQNLLNIKKSEERLSGFSASLFAWLEAETAKTELDKLYIPVSVQSGILEKVDVYIASLLSIIDTPETNKSLRALAYDYIARTEAKPSRIKHPEEAWQIIELASLQAGISKSWEDVEIFNKYLLQDKQKPFFDLVNSSDIYRTQLSYALALRNKGIEMLKDVPFITNFQEKENNETQAQNYIDQSDALLQKLAQLSENNTAAIVARVRAKQLLEGNEDEVMGF